MLLNTCTLFQCFFPPVCRRFLTTFIILNFGFCETRHISNIYQRQIQVFRIFICIHHLRNDSRFLKTKSTRVSDFRFPLSSSFCSDNDYAIGSTRTIYSSRRCIFQYRNTFNLIGVQFTDRPFYTIDKQ